MNKVNISFVIALLISITSTITLFVNDTYSESPYEYLTPEINAAKAFTLEVLEGFSEENYDFKPVEDMRSFRAQAFHIAYSLEWFNAQLSGAPIAWEPGDEDRMEKDELVLYTEEQFDNFIKIIQSSEESGTITRGILSTLRHNSHHRGQMVAYYRANNMVPPSYR